MENKRETIPVCMKHNKFKTKNGRWVSQGNAGKHLYEHMEFTGSKDCTFLPSKCDECEDDD